jgi:PHD/YefM family antitoxin component YafN of YafNO toxin-antitoxin module
MIEPADVYALTDFQRNAKAHIRRLRKSGRPEILTVNGKAAVIVQDAAAYTEMIRQLEEAHIVEAVRVGIEQMEAGKGVPFEEVAKELRASFKKRRRSA